MTCPRCHAGMAGHVDRAYCRHCLADLRLEWADRVTLDAYYAVILPAVKACIRMLPTSTVRRLRDRAERREARARYADERTRVGILRRQAVDRFDARSDATGAYYWELRRRNA